MSDAQDHHDATNVKPSASALQEFLDKEFSLGACAVVASGGTTQIALGRLLCSNVEQGDNGSWWYQLTIESPKKGGHESKVKPLWISLPRRHGGGVLLWESTVRADKAAVCVLTPLPIRLSANDQ